MSWPHKRKRPGRDSAESPTGRESTSSRDSKGTNHSSGGGNLMKTFLKTMVAVGAVVLAFAAAPGVMAQSCSDSAPFQHALGGFFTGLPEASLAGRASKVGDPSIFNGSSAFLCSSTSTAGIDFCQPE